MPPVWPLNLIGDTLGAAIAAGLALGVTGAGVLGRMVYMELRGRVERAEAGFLTRIERSEGRIDEIHLRYARRDDIARELEAIRNSFTEVFSELRRANEGIAALRGGEVR